MIVRWPLLIFEFSELVNFSLKILLSDALPIDLILKLRNWLESVHLKIL